MPIDNEGTTSQLWTTLVTRPRVRRARGIDTVAGGPKAYTWMGRPAGNGDAGLVTKGVEGGYNAEVAAM